jgi:hypothetical protein
MAKMTKAQARRRLEEACKKINLVMFVTDLSPTLTANDNKKLMHAWDDLQRIIQKLK